MQVEDSNTEEALILKSKRPRITLEPYDERKVEVIHDDGQEIYEPYELVRAMSAVVNNQLAEFPLFQKSFCK
jgi:hypothetical protein